MPRDYVGVHPGDAALRRVDDKALPIASTIGGGIVGVPDLADAGQKIVVVGAGLEDEGVVDMPTVAFPRGDGQAVIPGRREGRADLEARAGDGGSEGSRIELAPDEVQEPELAALEEEAKDRAALRVVVDPDRSPGLKRRAHDAPTCAIDGGMDARTVLEGVGIPAEAGRYLRIGKEYARIDIQLHVQPLGTTVPRGGLRRSNVGEEIDTNHSVSFLTTLK